MDHTYLILWLISAVTVLITAFVGGKIIPFLREKGLYSFTSQAVKAAATYFLDGQGREKFDWVFAQIDARYGKYFNVETIKTAIQAAYVDMCAELGRSPSPAKSGGYAIEE